MSDRIIPLEEVQQHEYYADLAPLARIFNHAVVETEGGTWRWQENRLMRRLLDGDAPFYRGREYFGERTLIYRGSLSLNDLWFDLAAGAFPIEQMVKFYMQSGYSLSGFCEVFNKEAKYFHADAEGDEDVIDYLNRKYEGQVLPL